jgi:hypothetical protein
MKYIKKFEKLEEPFEKFLKVGDKVRFIKNTFIPIIDPETYLIIEIDMPYWKVSDKSLELYEMLEYKIDKLSPDGYRTYETKCVSRKQMVRDYEIVANKFNI